MAHDDRPGDDPKPKRRGKAPIITLEAADVTPPVTDSAGAEAQATETPALDAPATPSDEPPAPVEPETASMEPVTAEVTAPVAAESTEAPTIEAPPADAANADTIAPDPIVAPAEPPPPPPADPAPAPGGFGRLVAAGFVGALLTGGLGVGAVSTGLVTLPAGDGAARDARIEALEAQLRQVAARPAATPAPAAPDLTPLTRRIEALDAARATLESRLATLEQRPAATGGTAASAAPAPAVDLTPLRSEIDSLKAEIARLSARPADATAAAAISPADIDQRIASAVTAARDAERRIAELDAQVRAARTALTELAPKVSSLETSRGQAGDSGRRAALVVSLGALRAAVERGQSYAAELRAAAALGLPAEAVAALEPQAERGLPTIAALTQRFTALAPELLKAATPPSSDGSLLDRLTASAQSLVRVRPVGEAAGDDVPTVIARIEAKLRRSDLAGALADLDKLPERVKTSTAAFAAEARARLGADTTLRRLSAEAATAMGGG
ncbi:COG4223 family protein [Phreatobacter oligotrophus]|jgi:hypothetical protein|uniref:COG4223 family protein n=1 Tax=Phreatobacter oligotrophus TaxID=1122261 RepID=UPI0023521549|nr:mitofilin family membrane protein [Phreatobacter oligotrophus]MBX9992538.1 hypothetical protein [Phreatobacter oligotrophus]